MRPQLKALVDAFAEDVDDLITELVEERVAPIKAALENLGIKDAPAKGPGGKPKYSATYVARIVAEVEAGKKSGRAIADREGIRQATLFRWVMDAREGKRTKKTRAAKKIVRRREWTEAQKKALAVAAMAIDPTERVAFAAKKDVSPSLLYSWMKEYAGYGGRGGDKPARGAVKGKRRTFTDDFKRALVAKALVLAPGERELLLTNEGIDRELYYKWVSWSKKNPG